MTIKLTRGRVALIVAALIVGVAGVSYAAIPAANGTISACRDNKGSLKVIDAESGQTCTGNSQLLTWNQQGPQGPGGPQGPSGVVQGLSATGAVPPPSAILQFFGAPVSVSVTSPAQRVLVVSNNAFGTFGAAASSLNLFICYQQPPGPVTSVGNGIINLKVPPNTKVPMGLSKVLQLSPSANPYLVGMCGTGGANWTNNDWGTTSALVFNQ